MVDADGSVQFINLLGWLLSVVVSAWLLFVAAPRMGRRRTTIWAVIAIGGTFLVPAAIIFIMWGTGFQPPIWFGNRLFQLIFTCAALALLSLMTALFSTMMEAMIRFHETHNAPNLHRFPLRFVIRNRALLEQGFTGLWWLGSMLIFYGIWTDLQI